MNEHIRDAKQRIRAFAQAHYDDQRLCAMLAHLQSGRFRFMSCCCFIGGATADHAFNQGHDHSRHYDWAKYLDMEFRAEDATFRLAFPDAHTTWIGSPDWKLCVRRLTAIVKAEIRRRDRLVAQSEREAVMELAVI